ncbi:MAG: hypothetical protein MZU97_10395 [Bacillus subtilis]|nr:hypothetical protein [Bacillus subtilis]
MMMIRHNFEARRPRHDRTASELPRRQVPLLHPHEGQEHHRSTTAVHADPDLEIYTTNDALVQSVAQESVGSAGRAVIGRVALCRRGTLPLRSRQRLQPGRLPREYEPSVQAAEQDLFRSASSSCSPISRSGCSKPSSSTTCPVLWIAPFALAAHRRDSSASSARSIKQIALVRMGGPGHGVGLT